MLTETTMAYAMAILVVGLIPSHDWPRSHELRKYRLFPRFPAVSTSVQKASLSERLGHLELLLNELRSASEALVATLHAEAEFGEKALAAEPRDSIALWREHRNEVERAQSMYCQAVREYRHFVNERPESLRATAVRRGEQANALAARELALLPK